MGDDAMNSRDFKTAPSDLYWPITTRVTRPPAGSVQVWCSILRCDPGFLSGYKQLLSLEEAHRASRFGNEELRHRFVMSRGLLRTVLGSCLNTPPGQVEIRLDANGKPRLADNYGVTFNLTHTGDLMLLAVTGGLPVGVDVERVRPMKDSQAMAQRFFSPREARWLQSLEGSELDLGFFGIWTRKEAILKATGEGISSGLSSIDVLDGNEGFAHSVPADDKCSVGRVWRLRELHPAKGFVGALALPALGDSPRLELATLRPT